MVREDRSVSRRAWEILTVKINEVFNEGQAAYELKTGQEVTNIMEELMKVSSQEAEKEFRAQRPSLINDGT